jgi:arylsulfatase A-like enzyme
MPPNVLWICADDYTPDACGAYGNRVARTPNIDRLAREGVRLDRAFAACPLSTPSRQSFWTGRYPRSIGVTLSPTPLPDDEITLPARLRAAGYEIAAFGKTHFYCPRPDEFDVRLDFADYHARLDEKGMEPLPRGADVLGPWQPFHDPPEVWLNAGVQPFAAVDGDMFGTYLARNAAEYLRKPHTKPFFCYVSTFETHSPFNFPADWPFRHRADEFTVPAVTSEDRADMPDEFQSLTDHQKRGIVAAYHTCANFMDRNVGTVLDALDSSGLANDTLVLFTSDHGYFLGQHGRFEKHSCYDPGIRAAVVARWPGRFPAGRASDALVELPDLAPTVLEACGMKIPPEMQARTLLPLFRGETNTHRDRVFIEYADNAEAAIRTDRWKLIYCAGTRRRMDGYVRSDDPRAWIKLFDLHADPGELVNLAGRTEFARVETELLAALADHIARTARGPLAPRGREPRAVLDLHLNPRDVSLREYLFRKADPR